MQQSPADQLNVLFQQASNIIKNSGPTELRTILADASKKGYLNVVKYMIQHGAHPDHKSFNETPLHLASKAGQIDIINYIFLYDDTSYEDMHKRRCLSRGMTALHYAAENGQNEVVELLTTEFEAKTNVFSRDGYTPLHYAVFNKHIDVVKKLLSVGAGVNIPSRRQKRTPLSYAVEYGDNELSKSLIDHGADLNIKCGANLEPLIHFAVQINNEELVKHLIEKGANLNVKNRDNLTPSELASQRKNYKLIKLFLEKKADENDGNDTYEENKITDKEPCIICFRNRNGIYVFNPCGHASLCELCCVTLMSQNDSKNCPTCRKPIQDYIKVFFQQS